MSEPTGIEKQVADAVEAARGGNAGGEGGGDQLGLDLSHSEDRLPLPDAGELLAIQAEHGGTAQQALQKWRASGCKGRKPGAVNRSTVDFERYMLQFGPHPGVALMRMMQPVDTLADALGCKRLEAAELQRKVASELLPYFQGRKPVAIDVQGKGHMTLVLGAMAVPGSGAGDVEHAGSGVPVMALQGSPETAENCGSADDGEGKSE